MEIYLCSLRIKFNFFHGTFGFLFYRNQPELYGLLPDGRIDVPLDDDNINNNDFDDVMNKNEYDDKKNSNNVSIAKILQIKIKTIIVKMMLMILIIIIII